MSDYPPILNGGMLFNGTAFTVLENGIYYIYGLVTIEHDGVQTCGFSLAVGADCSLIANNQVSMVLSKVYLAVKFEKYGQEVQC